MEIAKSHCLKRVIDSPHHPTATPHIIQQRLPYHPTATLCIIQQLLPVSSNNDSPYHPQRLPVSSNRDSPYHPMATPSPYYPTATPRIIHKRFPVSSNSEPFTVNEPFLTKLRNLPARCTYSKSKAVKTKNPPRLFCIC
jgi:hypothetical protein